MPVSGVGLLETIGVRHGRAPLWPLHLDRLRRSARELDIALPSAMPRPTGGGDHLVRYTVTDGRLIVGGRPLEPVHSLRLVTTGVVHEGYPHKTDQREWLEAARREAVAAGSDDALLLDHAGRVVEASIWTVGWWKEDGLHFPALTLCGLRSVARRRIGELVRVLEAREGLDAVLACSVIACNAARGIVEVAAIDGCGVARDPRTGDLQRAFWERADA